MGDLGSHVGISRLPSQYFACLEHICAQLSGITRATAFMAHSKGLSRHLTDGVKDLYTVCNRCDSPWPSCNASGTHEFTPCELSDAVVIGQFW